MVNSNWFDYYGELWIEKKGRNDKIVTIREMGREGT